MKMQPVPSWATVYEVNDKFSPEKEAISGGYVMISSAEQVHIPSHTQNIQQATLVFNSAGIEYISTVRINFKASYQQIKFHRFALIRNGIYIDQASMPDISIADDESGTQDLIYNGLKTATIHFKDVRLNDILFINYSLAGQNPVFNDHSGEEFHLVSSDTMDRMVISVITDPDKPLLHKTFNTTEEPVFQNRNNLLYTTWDLKNISKYEWQYYPGWYNPAPHVNFSDFSSWSDVKSWALPLFQTKEKPSPELLTWINDVKSKFSSTRDRATYAIRWVQNEVRYLGLEMDVNSHQPAEPNKVFRNRHGDCKDKSLLLSTMLGLLGIESYSVLVISYETHNLVEQLPAASAFNHCIALVRLGGFTFYVDPTINFQGGVAPEIRCPYYGYGLVLNNKSTDLVKLTEPLPSRVVMNETFDVNENKGGTIKVLTTYEGAAADKMRSDFQYGSWNASQESYTSYYQQVHDSVVVATNLKVTDDTIANIFNVEENYIIGNFWVPLISTSNSELKYFALRGSLIADYLPDALDNDYDGPLDLYHPYTL